MIGTCKLWVTTLYVQGKNGFKLMPRVTLIYSHTNVIPKMNYSTEQPRYETVKPNLGKEINPLSVVYNPKVYQI